MFKKRLITLGVALFALISVVGIGFSSWYFANEKKADVDSNVLVTHASDFGEFKNVTSGTIALQLDQPTITSGAISNHNIGLFTVDGSGAPTAAVTELSGVWEVAMKDYNENNSNLNYSIIIYIKSATLGTYVQAAGGFTQETVTDTTDHAHSSDYTAYRLDLTAHNLFIDGAANNNTNKTGAYVDTTTDSTKASVTFKLDLANDASFFQWKENQAPTTFEQYQAMVAALQCTGVAQATDVTYGKTYLTTGTDVIVEFVVSRTAA